MIAEAGQQMLLNDRSVPAQRQRSDHHMIFPYSAFRARLAIRRIIFASAGALFSMSPKVYEPSRSNSDTRPISNLARSSSLSQWSVIGTSA
jgi:hypothetical protein